MNAELDTTRECPKGIKITAKQIKDLEKTGILHRHDFHDEWNYTVKPGTELRVLFLYAYLSSGPQEEPADQGEGHGGQGSRQDDGKGDGAVPQVAGEAADR